MYYNPSYLINNNPLPNGIQFKIVTGDRSIGKTHAISKYLIRKLNKENAVGMIVRYDKYSSILPWGRKFFSDSVSVVQHKFVLEVDNVIRAYVLPLSIAYKTKNDNYDFPYISDCIFDELITPKYIKDELSAIMVQLGTIARRTNVPFSPVTVWCTGNTDSNSHNPLMSALGLGAKYLEAKENKCSLKAKGVAVIDDVEVGFVWQHSDFKSPNGVINVTDDSIVTSPPHWISGRNLLVSFNYNGTNISVWYNGYLLYIGKSATSEPVVNYEYIRRLKNRLRKSINMNCVTAENIEFYSLLI